MISAKYGFFCKILTTSFIDNIFEHYSSSKSMWHKGHSNYLEYWLNNLHGKSNSFYSITIIGDIQTELT